MKGAFNEKESMEWKSSRRADGSTGGSAGVWNDGGRPSVCQNTDTAGGGGESYTGMADCRQSEEDEDGSGNAGIFEAKSLENIISIYGGSERRYIRQRISVRRMGQYDNRMDEPACAQNKERHEGLYG